MQATLSVVPVQRPLFACAAELALMSRGYLPIRETPAVEAEITAESECPTCGEVGLAAVAYCRGDRLAVVAVCPFCSTGEEV